MILYPPAKINLGLNILSKREDGYHEIETCMLPIPFYDILEITKSEAFEFVQSGLLIPGEPGTNLCEKAFRKLQDLYPISNVRIHLRKQIPMGAGLGGGSSDAAYVLKGLNNLFELKINEERLETLAGELGSDCPFFIKNHAQIAKGRGEVLKEISIDLSDKYLIVLNPGIHVGTKEAYEGVIPSFLDNNLENVISSPISGWQSSLKNQFENHIFIKYPKIAELKQLLIDMGAVYASMSGSGSSLFGIFDEKPDSIHSEVIENMVFQGRF
jgi:4-diphosphocytidyl-2-C-methyl-D-erythritol kinase